MNSQPETIGRYKILERVGRGSMGVVYRAFDPKLDRDVAIKVMAVDLLGDVEDDTRQRFLREAKSAARLQHRNIVTVFEYDETDGVNYIVMEFLHGQSLAQRLKIGPPISVEQRLDIVAGICTGLEFAHRNGIIHRDVKPANIWLNDDGTVKLLDFGIARFGAATITSDGQLRGSAGYIAPEQIRGDTIDGRADVFAAAVVLFELFSGKTPFESPTPTATIRKLLNDPVPPIESLVPNLPPALVAALHKGLEKDPACRYQTAGDFAFDLQLIRFTPPEAPQTVPPLPAASPAPAKVSTPPAATPAPAIDSAFRKGTDASRHDRPTALGLSARGWIVVAAGTSVGIIAIVAILLSSGHELAPGPSTPSTSAPPPRSYHLHIDVEPKDAVVLVDGAQIAQAMPADLTFSGTAQRRIQVSKNGFQPMERDLTPEEVSTGNVHIKLTPVAAVPLIRITAEGDYEFEIRDGSTDGSHMLSSMGTKHSVSVPGSLPVWLRSRAYFLNRKVDPSEFRGTLHPPALGTLMISVMGQQERCDIKVDGWSFGFANMIRSMAAGPHRVTACEGADGLAESIEVKPGPNPRLTMGKKR